MIDKIPPALLHQRYGGRSTAHEMRKEVFFHQAPSFLRLLLSELGPEVEVLPIEVKRDSTRTSGVTAQYKSSRLHLMLTEDELRQDGLKLQYTVFDRIGTTVMSGTVPVAEFQKGGRLAILLSDIRGALRPAHQQMTLH